MRQREREIYYCDFISIKRVRENERETARTRESKRERERVRENEE